MPRKPQTNFFKKNGKYLAGLVNKSTHENEFITSLFATENAAKSKSIKVYKLNVLNKISTTIKSNLKFLRAIKVPTKANFFKPNFSFIKKIDFKYLWIGTSFASFTFFALITIVYPFKTTPNVGDKYKIFSATPTRAKQLDFTVGTRDSRAQKIDAVFKEYNCPLEGLGEIFVREADRNGIPWWLVASVSFQESSCGKKTPEPEGLESYNAWGWAVYGDNVHSFDNWVRGIERVSRYMSENFYSKGVAEPCDIMKTYTPPSQGSWCEGVKYFGEQFINYKTPQQ